MKNNWIKEVWQDLNKKGKVNAIAFGVILALIFFLGIGFISWFQYGAVVACIGISVMTYMYFTRNNDDN